MNWIDCLTTLSVVAKYKTFAEAARHLDQTPPMVTRKIQWLEEKLSTQLIIRTSRSFLFTEAGNLLLSQSAAILDQLEALQYQFHKVAHQPQGELNISISPSVLSFLEFTKPLKIFARQYPLLSIFLHYSMGNIDIVKENIDVLIAPRNHLSSSEDIVGQKLFDLTYGCYGSPQYIQTKNRLNLPADLHDCNCLRVRKNETWFFNGKEYQVSGNYICPSLENVANMSSEGLGLCYIPEDIAKHYVEQNKLVKILKNHRCFKKPFYAFRAKQKYLPVKTQLFIDFIKNNIKIKSRDC